MAAPITSMAKDGITPVSSLQVTSASSGNVAAATAAATLAAPSNGQTMYLVGFELTGAGATGASVIVGTVTGLLGGTISFDVAIPAGVTTAIQPLIVEFSSPLPASAANTAIVVSFPSFGAGNTNACVNAHGYQQ